MHALTDSSRPDQIRALLAARIAISAIFLVPGFGAGLWAVHIPVVTSRIGIDPAIVGIALLSAAIGAVLAMPFAGVLIGRFGSRLPTICFALAFCVVSALPAAAPNTAFLIICLFFFGAFMGGCDVSMNMQAAEYEEARGRPAMSSFHGFYSVGTLLGALAGGVVIGMGWGDGSGALIAAAILLAGTIVSSFYLLPGTRRSSSGATFALPPPAVFSFGVITFLVFAGEGGIMDWSALYLTEVLLADAATAASAVAAFSTAMVIFRLTGDWIVGRIGPLVTVVGGALLMGVGAGIAVLSPWIWPAVIGFGIFGMGAANVVPVAFSAAARTPGVPPGIGIAAVTTMGYGGFLIFPPLLGFVGRAWGLTASIAIIAAMGFAVLLFARSFRH